MIKGEFNTTIFKGVHTNYCRFKATNGERRANYAHENKNVQESQDNLFLSDDMVNKSHQEVWYLNSYCSNHMTGNKKLLANMNEDFMTKIMFSDNKSLDVVAKGKIEVDTK